MDLDLALIGNGTIAALVDPCARIVWCCLPRFDSDPVFDALLRDDGEMAHQGLFAIDLLDFAHAEQRYEKNTAVLTTILHDDHGGRVEVVDFMPRFRAHGRMFQPTTIVRRLRLLAGAPRMIIRLRPVGGFDGSHPDITFGSNHIRYVMPERVVRLTTDASITAVLDETPFILENDLTLFLGPDETLEGTVSDVGRLFHEQTSAYWREWVRYLTIPYEWQREVIRAAITLKLNAFDDTGAIVAAVTTSIPEAADSGRNWDYRYCWLRDAYFVVSVLGRLGKTKTMERYLSYIINTVAASEGGPLQPVYRINGSPHLPERIIDSLPGYRGMGPVRVGNQAAHQVQHDVYGAAVLAAAHVFFDERIERRVDEQLFHALEPLGRRALEVYDQPDAGPWELRGDRRVHTFSSVMCWAACDRLARIASRLDLQDAAVAWATEAARIRKVILARAWSEARGTFTATFDGDELDAMLLLLPQLGFVEPRDPRFLATLEAIGTELRQGELLFRYRTEDDFGQPRNAFVICSFWYINALAETGRRDEARELFERMLSRRNRHGLLSEDIDFQSGELWGNFPQTYSMVGLIDSAIRLSRPWEEAF